MFEKVRRPNRAKGILAYFIFGAIIVVFIGFGMSPRRAGDGMDANGVAAIVNQSQISIAEFDDRVRMMERQLQFRMDQADKNQRVQLNRMLRQRALEDLIQYEVMVQAAREHGVLIADKEVRDFILEIPAFQEAGRFKRDYYNRFLEQRRESAGEFEDKVRKDILVRKAETIFRAAFRPSNSESELEDRLEGVRLNLQVATVNSTQLPAKIQLSQSELSAYVNENLETLKKRYEENKAQYTEPEQVHARHILINVDRNKPESDASAKGRIEALLERAKTEDFAKLAQANSDDSGTKSKGGDLGFFGRGRMVPEFEAAAFKAEPGQLVGPIKTDFGYHLIKVEERKPERVRSFDDVKFEIARTEVAQAKIKKAEEALDSLVSKGNESGVKKVLQELGVEWSETGEFGLNSPTVTKLEDPERAISAVLKHGAKQGLVPEIIKSPAGTQVLMVKSLVTKNAVPNPMGNYVSSRRYSDAFSAWTKQAYERAKIRRNEQILAN